MALIEKQLDRIIQENILVDVFTDHFNETDVGYLRGYSDELLLIEAFNSIMRPAGITILMRKFVTRIRWGGNELTKSEELITHFEPLGNLDKINLTSVKTAIDSVNTQFGHVTLNLEAIDDSVCFIGNLDSIDDDHLVLHAFGTISSLDRKHILLAVEDITKIEANGPYEQQLVTIFK